VIVDVFFIPISIIRGADGWTILEETRRAWKQQLVKAQSLFSAFLANVEGDRADTNALSVSFAKC
jgi:hypothetical protein